MFGTRAGLPSILLQCSLQLIAQPSPNLAGTTSYVENGVYRPLDGVEVTVYRKAPVGQETSNAGGKFSVTFSGGPPVTVLFRGPDGHLPALQSLNANAGTKHQVHVTLYTIDEARKQGINSHSYVQSIINQLVALGVSPEDKQLQALRSLMGKIG